MNDSSAVRRIAVTTALVATVAVVAAQSVTAGPAAGPGAESRTAAGALSGVIPDGTCRAAVSATGGGGGSSPTSGGTGGIGGRGARINATVTVLPGQTFGGTVAGGGTLTAGGTGAAAGGAPGTIASATIHRGGGGGGSTSVVLAGIPAVVAGGGGGGGASHQNTPAGLGGAAGFAGIAPGAVAVGSNGNNGSNGTATNGGGQGGQVAAGGAGGVHSTTPALNGLPGVAAGTGGNGGPDNGTDSAGGGGGGFTGGGGGASTNGDSLSGAGGGGGSSRVVNNSPVAAGTAPTGVSGAAGPATPTTAGAGPTGSASIDWLPCVYDLNLTKTVSPSPISAGAVATWTVSVTNTGPDPMTRGDTIDLTDTLPPGPNGGPAPAYRVTSIATSGGSNANMASGPVTCAGVTVGSSMPASTTCSRPYSAPASAQAPSGGDRGLNVGETLTITYEQIIANTAACATITNTATVNERDSQTGTTDITGVTTTDTVNTPLTINCYDLAIAKVASPKPVLQGGTITWSITVTNVGTVGMEGPASTTPNPLIVTDTFPTGGVGAATLTGSTGPAGACTLAGSTVTCPAGLPAGGVQTLTFTQPVNSATPAGTVIANTATVTDPRTGDANDSATDSTTVAPVADLAITKTGPATVAQGNAVTYSVTATNNGPSDVTGASIVDTVPANLTGVSFTCVAAGTADCDTALAGTGATGTGNAISLTNVQLNAGAGNSVTITVTGTATTTAAAPGVTNTATIAPPAGTTDAVPGNNTSSVNTIITPSADLAIVKTGPATVVQGNLVTYSITATNSGPSNVTGASIADAVPANLTGVAFTCVATGTADCDAGAAGTGATGTGNGISLTNVQMNAGAGNSVTITVTGTAATPVASPGVTNTATIAPPAGTTDPIAGNNSSSVNTAITPSADLAVAKTGPASVVQGTAVTYTIVVSNNGPSNVTGAAVSDTVPANLTGVTFTCVAAGTADCDTGAAGTGATGVGNAISLTAVQLNAGAGNSVTITVTGTATTTGAITNTATVTAPTGTTDAVPGNNTSTVNTTITPAADLAIAKTGLATAVQGTTVSYTIVVTNGGPSNVTGATVADAVPSNLTGVSFACVAAGTADCDAGAAGTGATGTGNAISLANVQLNAGAGNSLTITVTGTATTTATPVGVTNTATVAPPAGTTDPVGGNNSSSVVTTITPSADLAIAKSGPATIVGGQPVTYTITATNNGPSNVSGASIADTVPADLAGVTWTCVATGTADCDAGAAGTGATGTGNGISLANVQLNAGAGNSVTITVNGTAVASPAATITNTASISPPAGTTDPVPANDTAATTASANPAADLSVTKTGPASVVQGNTLTYTIVVTNNGPANVIGATVADAVPAAITLVSFACVAAGTADCDTVTGGTGATGSGNAISLPNVQLNAGAGNSLTITVTGTATATGTITNTATVAPPAGTVDGNTANNASPVTTEITPSADLAITKTGTATAVQAPGTPNAVTYTIVVTNNGPSNVTGASVTDVVPSNLTGVSFTCVATGTADCDAGAAGTGATGSGNAISLANVQLNAGAGNDVTITVTATATTTGSFTNTAVVAPPAGTTDPASGNNSASQPTTVTPTADLAVTKTGTASAVQGTTVTYTIVATNSGPSPVTGASIADTVPVNLTNVSWTCVAAGIADCDTGGAGTGATGTGNAISLTSVQLDAGAANTVTITVTGTATTPGTFTNTATIAAPAGTTDPVGGNNSDDQATTVGPAADLAVTKTGPATVIQGTTATYTLTVTNNGPSPVTGASVADTVPSNFTDVAFSCVVTGTGDCDTTSPTVPFTGVGNAISLTNVQLNVDASLTITVTGTATTTVAAPGVTNTVTVTPPVGTTDPVVANDSASVDTEITPAADLAITKTGTATVVQASPGNPNPVTYTITVTNSGPSDVTGASIADAVPSNLTSVSFSCAVTGTADCDTTSPTVPFTGTGNTISLPNAQINAGAGNTIVITVTGTPTTVGTFTNTATVAPPAGTTDPTPGNNTASQSTTITPAADLTVTKTGPASLVQNEQATYTITVTNAGPSPVSGATVADTVPAAFTGVAWICVAAGTGDCDTVGGGTGATGTGNAISLTNVQLAPGDSLTITVTATATTPGAVTNTATVTPPTGTTDPNTANNTSQVNTTIVGIPEITVDKSAAVLVDTNPTGPSPGDTLRYTITITNTGTGPANGVTLSDIIDPLLTPSNPTASQGTATLTGNSLSATIGAISNVAPGNTATVTYDAAVPASLPAGVTQVANQAFVSGANFTTTPSNDPDTPTAGDPTVTPLTAAPNVLVDKAAAVFTDVAPTGPSPGDVFEYTITVTNTGNQDAAGVQLTDAVDPNVTLIANTASATPGTITAGLAGGPTVAANLGTIAASASAIVRYRVQVPNPIPAGVTRVENQAIVTGGNFPSTLSNDPSTPAPGDPTVLPLTAQPVIDVTKSANLLTDVDGNGVPSPGDTLLYTITVTNTGNQNATGVAIDDPIDATFAPTATRITNVQASLGTASVSGQQLTAALGTIPGNGGSATVTYNAQIPNPLPDATTTRVVNQATVTGGNVPATPSDDPDTATADDPTVTPLQAAPIVTATKQDTLFVDADGDGSPSPGDTLLYTVTITNSGNTPATGVTFNDTLDINEQLLTATVQTSPPATTLTTTATSINATFAPIPGAGGTVTVTFQARIRRPLPPGVTQVTNQATVSGTNFPATQSDDPDTATGGDPTVTPLTATPRVSATKVDTLVGDVNANGLADPGDTIAYTVTVTNAGNQNATDVRLADTVEANLQLVAGSVQTSPVVTPTVLGANISAIFPVVDGDGGTATLSFQATVVNPLPAGVTQVDNQTAVTGSNFPATVSDDPATGAPGDRTVTPVVAQPIVDSTKAVSLFDDADGNGVASPGDTLQYVVAIANTGNQNATNVAFSDTIGANLTVLPATLQVAPGPPINTVATATATTVNASFTGIQGNGGTATITFRAQINTPLAATVTSVQNQGNVTGGNFASLVTDDPATGATDDPTVTPITAAPIVRRDKTVAFAPGGDVNGNGQADPGDTLRYVVTLTNTGNREATGVVLTDLLDPSLVVPLAAGPIASAGGRADVTGSTLSAEWEGIPGGGGSVTLTFDAQIVASLGAGVTQIRNQANVSGTNFAGGPTNDPSTPQADDPNITQLNAAPNVSATKTVAIAPGGDVAPTGPSAGDTLLYTVVIRNTGNQDASGVTFADTIDPTLTLLPATLTSTQGTPAPGPGTPPTSFSVPDIGTIAGGGAVTITFRAQVAASLPPGVNSVQNQGIVDGANIPPTSTDDPSTPTGGDPTVTPLLAEPRLAATKSAALFGDTNGDGLAEPGEVLAYTVTITNTGNQDASGVTFDDIIEPNLTLIAGSATVTPGPPLSTATTTANAISAFISRIPGAGGSATITFRVTIDDPIPAGVTEVRNQGTVEAAGVPPFPTDDPTTGAPDDPTRTPVVAAPQIDATKAVALAVDADANGSPSPGDTLSYTIRITNSGNQAATAVAVSDIIDPNLEVVIASITPTPGAPVGATTFTPGAGAPFGGTLAGTFTAIPGGGTSATIGYQAIIRSPVAAGMTQVANQAQVTGGNFPPTPTDDPRTGTPDDPTITPILAEPNVDSTKAVSLVVDADGNGVASPGDTLAYSVEIINSGNREATGITFADTIEPNLALVPGTVNVSQGAVTAGAAGGTNVGANLGDIAGGGGSATIGFRVTIDNPLPAGVIQVANQGTVAGSNIPTISTDDPRTGTPDDRTTTPVAAAPVIVVDKAVALVVDSPNPPTPSDGVPSAGDTLLYTITIRNTGNQTATAVALNDIIDPNLVNITAVQTTLGTASVAGQTLSAAIGDISGGGTVVTVSFRAQIANPLGAGVTQVANQATVTGGNFAAVPSNDPATAQGGDPTVTPVTAIPVVTATKSDTLAVDADGDGVPSPGDTLAYIITITNSGNRTATGVQFADVIDPNLVFETGSVATNPAVAVATTATSFSGEFAAIAGGGGTATIGYRARVVNPLPAGVTQVANQAVITPNPTGGNFPATVSDDPDTGDALDPTVTPLTAAPRIAVTKTDTLFTDADGNGSPSPGDTLLYTVTVTNSGNGAATGVALTDIVDANLSANTPQASQGTVSVSGNTLNAALGTIPGGGGSATFSYRAVIADPLPAGVTQVENQAIVSGNFPTTPSDDPDTAAGGDPTVTPLTANPAIGVTKTDTLLTDADGNGVPSPGDTLLYTITVTNTGNTAATGVELSDVIGANLTGSNPAASQGTATIAGSSLTATLGTIPGRGASATVTFRAAIVSPLPAGVSQVANQAVVSGANFPGTVSDDPDTTTAGDPTVTPLIAAPVISVDKTATLNTDADGNGSPSPGDTLLYTITVRNSGNQNGVGAVANDVNDPNVTLIAGSVATSQGTVTAGNAGGNVVGVDLGVLPGGGTTATVTYLVRVANPLPAGVTSVANQALVSGTNFATIPSNDPGTPQAGDPTVTQLTAAPVLSASKAASVVVDADSNGIASPGDTILYSVTIANSGNQAAANTTYADTLDPNTTVVGSVQASQGTATGSGQSVSADFGTVPGGATVTLSYRALISAAVPPGTTQVVNQGTVSATGVTPVRTDDPATGPLGDPTVVQIVAAPRVLMTKTDVLTTDVNNNGAADLGDTITYTLVIQNVGNTAALNGVFTDTPDPNSRLVVGSVSVSAPAGATVTSGNGAGDTSVGVAIPAIGPGGEQVTVSFRVQIPDPLPEGITQIANQARLACDCPGSPILSDDPRTTAAGDPTITPLRRTETPLLRAAKVGTLAVDADRSGGASSGDTIAYTVQIVSAGSATAQNVVFNDTVDANTTIIAGSVTTSRGTITAGQQGGRQIQVSVGNLAPNAGATIAYRVTINPRVPASTTRIRNQGTVTALGIAGVATDDPSTGVAGDPTDLGVAGTTRLRIRKFGPVRAAAGTRTLYTIRVTNLGPNTAAGVVVTDQLPRGMVVSGRPRNATVRGRTVTWRIRSLAARRTVTLTLPVRVTARIGVRLTNTATVRASNAAPVRARARTLVARFRPPIPTG